MSRLVTHALTREIVSSNNELLEVARECLALARGESPERDAASKLRAVAKALGMPDDATADQLVEAIQDLDLALSPGSEGDEGSGDPAAPNAEQPPAALARQPSDGDILRELRAGARTAPTAQQRRDYAILARAHERHMRLGKAGGSASAAPSSEAEALRAAALKGPAAWAAARAKQRARQKAQRKRT